MWPALAAAAAVVLCIGTRPILSLLPEPEDGPAEHKTPYAALDTFPFVTVVALLGGLLTASALPRTPAPTWPLWLVLGTVGVLLSAIDARTTWLPLPLTRLSWLGTAAGVGVLGLLDADAAGRALLGAAATGAFFWLIWRVGNGLGFGDVRLAPVIGAVAAAPSWPDLMAALLLGTALGAGYGLWRALRGRRTPFAYGPFLVLGPYLSLWVPLG